MRIWKWYRLSQKRRNEYLVVLWSCIFWLILRYIMHKLHILEAILMKNFSLKTHCTNHCIFPDLRMDVWKTINFSHMLFKPYFSRFPWSSWSSCSAAVCGSLGWRNRTRQCRTNAGKNQVHSPCTGNAMEFTPCKIEWVRSKRNCYIRRKSQWMMVVFQFCLS